MKNKISVEKIIPVLEEKLSIKYVKFEEDQKFLYRKQADNSLAITEEDQGVCIAKISSKVLDRDGEILIPEGMDDSEFIKNPVIFINHDYSQLPIAKILKLEKTSEAIYAKIKFSDTERGQEVFTLVREGILRACSVGFVTLKALEAGTREFTEYVREKFNGIIDKACKRIITKWKLMENSLVGLGANQTALIEMVSAKHLHISDKVKKELNMVDEVKQIEESSIVKIDENIQPTTQPVEEKAPEVPVKEEAVKEEVKKEPERYMRLVSEPVELVVNRLVDEKTKKYFGKIS